MGARDLRPRAAGIEVEIALPVPDGLVAAPGSGERASEVEVCVSVIGRDAERAPIATDRLLDVAGILVQRAEVVGGFRTVGGLGQGAIVRWARLVVATHAMQQQAEVVPRSGVGRI